jgi:hypothetical protein
MPSSQMEKDICRWLEDKVIHYKQLRGGVVFVEKVPKTASGKVGSLCAQCLIVDLAKTIEGCARFAEG